MRITTLFSATAALSFAASGAAFAFTLPTSGAIAGSVSITSASAHGGAHGPDGSTSTTAGAVQFNSGGAVTTNGTVASGGTLVVPTSSGPFSNVYLHSTGAGLQVNSVNTYGGSVSGANESTSSTGSGGGGGGASATGGGGGLGVSYVPTEPPPP